MDISMAEGIAALAVAFGTIITVLVEKLRRDNNRDHGIVRQILKDIHHDVDDVRTDVREVRGQINNHMEWHADQAVKPKRGRPRKTED
jgi:hypothetical protein